MLVFEWIINLYSSGRGWDWGFGHDPLTQLCLRQNGLPCRRRSQRPHEIFTHPRRKRNKTAGSSYRAAFYTERYRRDEGEIDGAIQKLYLKDVQEAQAKLPHMTATIRGQDVRLDGRMNKLVWGGKANLPAAADEGGSSSNAGSAFGGSAGPMIGGSGGGGRSVGDVDDESNDPNRTYEDDGTTTIRKRPRKKLNKEKKRRKQKEKQLEVEETGARLNLASDRQKLVVQSTVAGVAIGAVAVAAVTVLMSGSRK